MIILEFKCGDCGYVFSRISQKINPSSLKLHGAGKTKNQAPGPTEPSAQREIKKEKCTKCGGKTTISNKIDLKDLNFGCAGCEKCKGCG